LGGALGYLAFDIAVLWVVLRAVGSSASIAAVILAYSIGYAADSLPVPGGIGVLDAGLTGALVLYGVSPVRAAAAVIVYHAIAFWVPGLGGLLAYLRLRPRLMRGGAPIRTELQPHFETLAREQPRHLRTRTDAETDPLMAGRRRSPAAGKCSASTGSSLNAPPTPPGQTSPGAHLKTPEGGTGEL
jgi:hypothetical protein